MITGNPQIVKDWTQYAEHLADWTLSRLAVRKDVFGAYTPDGRQYTAHEPLTREVLIDHYRGARVVGLHSTSPENRCLWAAFDIDAHDATADPRANWTAALAVSSHLTEYGLTPIVADSNGAGGYHVRPIFRRPVPVANVRLLCTRIADRLAADGHGKIEAFPKQAELSLDRPYGNWLRLPGKHPKRDHWTRLYDAESGTWLVGADAARMLLRTPGDNPAAVFQLCREEPPEPEPGWGRSAAERRRNGRHRDKADESTVREALDRLGSDRVESYDAWLGVGMALHDWDDARGLDLWHEFSKGSAKYEAAALDAKWTTFTAGGGLTVGTLFKEAESNGWEPPWKRKAPKVRFSANGNGTHAGNGKPDDAAWPAPADKVRIEVTPERYRMLELTREVLARDPNLYCRGDSLVTVTITDEDEQRAGNRTLLRHLLGSPKAVTLTPNVLGCHLSRFVDYYTTRPNKDGSESEQSVPPPDWIGKVLVESRDCRGIRPLLAIAECPFVREGGEVADRAGYDDPTGTLYGATMAFPGVPDGPDQVEAMRAAGRLLGLVGQFPFREDNDRAVWLAGLLTAIQRPAIDGAVPGFAVIGNTAGVGKGLLVDLIGLIATGRPIPTSSYPDSKEEAVKVKVAIALAARSLVHFDNLDAGTAYGNSALDSAITALTINERILGSSHSTGEIPLRVSWFLSGNNVAPGKDAYRRWLPCNLVSPVENPEDRSDFEVRDLRAHTLEHRGELVRDALTMLVAHARAGYPAAAPSPLGSFEHWDRVVRGAVHFATGCDPCHTRKEAARESPERLQKLALLEAWADLPNGSIGGVKVQDAISMAEKDPGSPIYEALVSMTRDGRLPTVRSLGNTIRAMRDMPIGGCKFHKAGEDHRSILWTVIPVSSDNP